MSLQARVGAWHRRRFPDAQMEHVALKSGEELGEVHTAVNDVVGKNSVTTHGGELHHVAEEAADVVICMMVLLERWVPGADLMEEVEKKLAILNDPNSGHRAALVG